MSFVRFARPAASLRFASSFSRPLLGLGLATAFAICAGWVSQRALNNPAAAERGSAGLYRPSFAKALTPAERSAAAQQRSQISRGYTKAAAPALPNEATTGGLKVAAKVFTSGGWVIPGGDYPLVLSYQTGDSAVAAVSFSVVLHSAAVFTRSTPAATSGNGTAASPLIYNLAALPPNVQDKIVIEARARSLAEDAEIIWKDISADISVSAGGETKALRTHGPKVTTLKTARFGDRPFPVVMVQYQDIKHCTGAGAPYPECTSAHTAEALDVAVNSQTTGTSLWQLYQDMSFGQLFPIGTVSPPAGSATVAFTPGYVHKFSTPQPSGFCSGTSLAAAHGTPAYGSRIENGWYLLPGNQGYYGSDKGGQNLASGSAAPLAGIDDGCGPIAKIVYDAASLADPDIEYSDYDTDKDGVVDFFNLMFAGCGGHGCTDPTGPNNIWPHKSDMRHYFTDADGQTGYVSNDQLKNHSGQPLYYTDSTRATMTTSVTAIPVYVRVGPYNVNPEDAVDHVSVVGHEYGHSLGLPDFYSNAFSAYGSWNLMGTDYFQYFDLYARQSMGWIVPRPLKSGEITLRESKFDTGEIHWTRADGTPYTLTGPGIHNADAYRLDLPTTTLIDTVPSGTHAWYSNQGNDFACAPVAGSHNLDISLPDLVQQAGASAVTLKFKSLYEMEWDYDYGFVLVSEDAGQTWTSLASQNGTTINGYNPQNAGCYTTYGNGITGSSGSGANTQTNLDRAQSLYATPVFIDDEFDLTAYKGKDIILRFHYYTDPGVAKRGWFIDDIEVTADAKTVYASDFEADDEATRLFPAGWIRASTTDGVETERAYFIELRDRIGNDFDGKNQSERGAPGWEGGVSLMYSDRNHGYGNTAAANHPAQTPVDAVPDPGNASPDLNDAAFTLGRPEFNGCTHIDNYPDPTGPNELWKLPEQLRFTVTALSGLSIDGSTPAQPATATILAEIYPDCSQVVMPPELSIGTGYENPDTDGAYQLSWTRPAGAVGPDLLQESSSCTPSFTDDAEETLVAGENATWAGSPQWSSQPNPGDNSTAYFIPDSASQDESLEMTGTIDIPRDFSSTLSFTTRQGLEAGYDFGYVEVSTGSDWRTVASYTGPDALDPATVFEGTRTVDLSEFAGQTIKMRFRLESDSYNVGAPAGWYVDNIQIINSDWTALTTTAGTIHALSGHAIGAFCYRVQTRFAASGTTLASPFSNIVNVDVVSTLAMPPPPAGTNVSSDKGRFGGALSLWLLVPLLFAPAAIRLRERRGKQE